MNERLVAFCGLVCNECPAFIATVENDDEKKKKTAEMWSSEDYKINPEDVECDGCTFIGKKIMAFCFDCKVRQCGIGKRVENCAYCDDYPCDILKEIWEFLKTDEAKATLNEIREKQK
jgi:hypothetical protein